MGTAESISDLIGEFYEAAFEPPRWTRVLERTADFVSAHGATLQYQDQITGKGWGFIARIDPAAVAPYFGYFGTRNPIRKGRNDLLQLSRSPDAWRSLVINDEQALPKPELMRSEYYNDFLKPFGLHSLLMFGIAVEDTRFASINLCRPAGREQFAQEEIDAAATLQPHLIRAFGLGRKLSDVCGKSDGLANYLDHCAHALFLTDSAGRVVYSNDVADTLLARNAGLAIRAGVLCATMSSDARKLHAAIAVAGERDAERRSGSTLTLARQGRRSLPVIVAPMRSEQLFAYSSGPSVMVCASDPDSAVVLPAERLRQLYGFTPAEAKIALELLSGFEPKRIAERHSSSIRTVRVHITRILAKTETSRQADLVRLLARVCGMPVDTVIKGTPNPKGNGSGR